MPILRDIPVALVPEQILAGRGRRTVQPGLLQDAAQAIALGQTLWQPATVYDWFEIVGLEGEEVRLAAGDGFAAGPGDGPGDEARRQAVLHVGPKAGLLAGAQRALVAVGTLGPALEERVQAMAGDSLHAYLLDSAGVVALGAVGEALRCVVEEAATAQGWGVSPAISPGSLVGWSLRGQRELCGLLPLEQIGVRLSEHCVLQPHKSFSTLIAIGPGLVHTKVGSVCKFCALQDTCWRRREEPS